MAAYVKVVVVDSFLDLGVLLVNLFIVARRFLMEEGVEEKNIWSQYEFRKQIALSWLSPELEDPRYKKTMMLYEEQLKRKANKDNFNNEALIRKKKKMMTTEERYLKKTVMAPRCTNGSLNPTHGSLHDRLKIKLGHWPIPSVPRTRCQLHRWATDQKYEYTKGVCKCSYCGINLCLLCFKKFYTCAFLVEEKAAFARQLIDEKASIGANIATNTSSV